MPRKFIFHPSLVTDRCVSIDPVNDEIIQGVYKKSIREGEERLMLAVLESAVEDFQTYVLARTPSGKKLFQQAEQWFLEKDGDELFSFENICETLELHPDYIRQGLMVWKEARLKTLSVEGDPQDRTKLGSTRIRHHPVRLSKVAQILDRVQPKLTFRALSDSLIVFLSVMLVGFSLVSMWKENRFGWPLRFIIWFYLAIICSCAVIGLLAGYVQKAKSSEKVSRRINATATQ